MDQLQHKVLYGFGDSLIAGHELHIGLLDDFAQRHQLEFHNFAANGATIIPTQPADHTWASENQVPDLATQIKAAPAIQPDLIIFDGTTNDAISYVDQLRPLGQIAADFLPISFDTNTYCGCFELVLQLLRSRYPLTPIYFVGVHHMPAIPLERQDKIQATAAKICGKWGIPVIDLYHAGQINTFIAEQARQYSYNNGQQPHAGGDGTHLNAEGYQRFYTPMLEAKITPEFND
ncbi:lysophospholipase [Lapidilactobacillus dextrinicus DSM 20335]|uniref:Lysophospholipase n=1 Tax=Lapidilactobacillus dextrinicus DSM 20335 TaxID=1423738 RepID=A0A0R2BKW9_9LACO|nr:SGNH/GDSL hydrolase family protein [Lapidilactobacillus dextrinicus]KRM79202.1 lysophospholipase [Lapidilactobacillus dextrinicus DSM 20335]QFG46955.1 SGNH/GDSL hydrolase family protein [Lapidilactobacillus dextrinicus]